MFKAVSDNVSIMQNVRQRVPDWWTNLRESSLAKLTQPLSWNIEKSTNGRSWICSPYITLETEIQCSQRYYRAWSWTQLNIMMPILNTTHSRTSSQC